MASQSLTLRMRAWGSRQTEREVDRVRRSVRDTGDEADKTSHRFRRAVNPANAFTRALKFMSTRAVITAITIGTVGVALAALSPAAAMAIAGLTTLGALMAPVFVVGLAAARRFQQQVGILGSEANELARVFLDFRKAFDKAMGPGADIVLGAVTDALRTLRPLIGQLAGPMTVFARSVGAAIGVFAAGLAGMGPEIADLVTQLGPFMVMLAKLGVSLTRLFITIATAGIPALTFMLGKLIELTDWLSPAVEWLDRFLHSAAFTDRVAVAFFMLGEAGDYLADIIHSLWGIATQLFQTIEPFLPLVGQALLAAFTAFAGALEWVNQNFATLEHLVVPLLAAFAAYKLTMLAALVATKALTLGMRALFFLISMHPIMRLILILVALGTALVTAYKKSETFRRIVDGVWSTIRNFAMGVPGALKSAFTSVLNWMIDRVNNIIDALNVAIDAFNFLPGPDIGRIGKLGNVGGGGLEDRLTPNAPRIGAAPPPTSRGGATGPRRRREGVRRPGTGPRGGADRDTSTGEAFEVPVTVMLPNGDILGKTVAKAGRKKKSVR